MNFFGNVILISVVFALCSAITYLYDIASPYIAATILGIITNDDGRVEKQAGNQGKALNIIMLDMFSGNQGNTHKASKALISHVKSQVFVGTLPGIAINRLYTHIVGA